MSSAREGGTCAVEFSSGSRVEDVEDESEDMDGVYRGTATGRYNSCILRHRAIRRTRAVRFSCKVVSSDAEW